jgi:signal transduction histidine kinase
MDELTASADGPESDPASHRHRLRAGLAEREEERKRWARELHDETLQQLGAVQVLLSSARQKVRSGRQTSEEALVSAVDTAIDLLAAQINGLRQLITELRPAALDELGLRAPLHALAQRTEALTGVKVDMRVSLRYADGQVSTRLLPDIEVAIYRVIQEALTNASRHSGASCVEVSVIERDGQVFAEVSDDGKGMSEAAGVGFGIVGMRERAALAGGHLEVLPGCMHRRSDSESSASGTLIRLVVPASHRTAESPS